MRIFLALPLAEKFLNEIAAHLAAAKDQWTGVKWVEPEQVHVTLHFFGEVEAADIQTIESVITPLAAKCPALELRLQGIGFFPNPHKPRVVWLGVAGKTVPLLRLQSDVESALRSRGFPSEERLFQPHATIGRVKDSSAFRNQSCNVLETRESSPKLMERIVMYQSRLTPQGPHYEVLKTFSLG